MIRDALIELEDEMNCTLSQDLDGIHNRLTPIEVLIRYVLFYCVCVCVWFVTKIM